MVLASLLIHSQPPIPGRLEICTVDLDRMEIISLEAVLLLGLMWKDIVQTITASCDIKDLDGRLKQFNNPRDLSLPVKLGYDPNPQFQVRKSIAVRALPQLSAVILDSFSLS